LEFGRYSRDGIGVDMKAINLLIPFLSKVFEVFHNVAPVSHFCGFIVFLDNSIGMLCGNGG